MNDRRLEDFAWMGESLVNNSLRNGFEFDEAKASVQESDGEDFAIVAAHFRTESIVDSLGRVEGLLDEVIFASQGGEAQRGHQSSSFGFGEDTAKVCDGGTRKACEGTKLGEELAGEDGTGGVQQERQGVDFSEGISTKVAQPLQRAGVKRDRVVDLIANRRLTLPVRFEGKLRLHIFFRSGPSLDRGHGERSRRSRACEAGRNGINRGDPELVEGGAGCLCRICGLLTAGAPWQPEGVPGPRHL